MGPAIIGKAFQIFAIDRFGFCWPSGQEQLGSQEVPRREDHVVRLVIGELVFKADRVLKQADRFATLSLCTCKLDRRDRPQLAMGGSLFGGRSPTAHQIAFDTRLEP
jgi:hypothetical protein